MSVKHYERVIALLPEPAMVVTSLGKLLAANHSAAALFKEQSVAQETLWTSLTTESQSHLLPYLRLCARSKQPLVGAISLTAKKGEVAFTTHGAVLEPQSPSQEALILLRLRAKAESNVKFRELKEQINELNREIARRRRAEYELTAQTQWLQITLTSIGDAVITTDADGNIAFMNPVAEAMTGWTQEEGLRKPLHEVFFVVNEHTGAAVENPAEKALRERRVVTLANHTVLIAKGGSRIAIEDTAAPITLDDEIKGSILVFHDVSQRRQLEQQLMERASNLELANRRKNEFLTMLAHELRSPLAPISNAVEIMSLQADAPAVYHEPRKVIERQVQHLKRLIDDMLDVSRITSGKMHIKRQPVDLAALTASACSDFQAQFRQAHIRLSTSLPAAEVWIEADAHRITQVLHNLLINAQKFTPPNGSVDVTLTTKEDLAVLSVTDTGIGIDEALMGDLFEPFTQAAQSLDRSTGGLGLGLSLVKGIINLHHGQICATSDGEHQGTAITISLPLTRGQSIPNADSQKAANNERLHRVLVIEDEPDAAATLKQLLELLGHEVHVANTGPEGLKLAIDTLPTLIFCDIGLPGMDGFSVVARLRATAATSAIPIAALSGYGDTAFVNRAKAVGFDHHITKPATLADIEAALAIRRS